MWERSCMNETVKEWIAKGEADFATATRELQALESPNFDAVCFHAQQCIEKLMKALMIHLGAVPPRTHDLVYLDELLRGVCPQWSSPVDELRFVSRAAVAFRYPGESSQRADAAEALQLASPMRDALLDLLKASR